MWFSKTFEVRSKEPGARPVERTLWLCPDCSSVLGSGSKRAAFLQKQVKG